MLEKRSGLYYRDSVQITPEEYIRALAEIREKAVFVNSIYLGIASIDDVPEEWQEEIQQRVEARLAEFGADDPEISPEEAMGIIVGGAV